VTRRMNRSLEKENERLSCCCCKKRAKRERERERMDNRISEVRAKLSYVEHACVVILLAYIKRNLLLIFQMCLDLFYEIKNLISVHGLVPSDLQKHVSEKSPHISIWR
jgi:hypothetical protein